MKKIFAATQHYIVLALEHNHITFPTSKKQIMAKAGNESIRVDWDSYISLSDYCKEVKLEEFANKAVFFNAVLGANTNFNF